MKVLIWNPTCVVYNDSVKPSKPRAVTGGRSGLSHYYTSYIPTSEGFRPRYPFDWGAWLGRVVAVTGRPRQDKACPRTTRTKFSFGGHSGLRRHQEVFMCTRGMRGFALTGLVFSLCFFFAVTAFGQSQTLGTISGTISDSTGALIPGAKITATNKGTGQSVTATTNDAGYYVVTNMPAGTYDVTAEASGFQKCANTGVTLDPAASVQLTCTMQVGPVTQTVEVTAPAVYVQTNDAKVSRVVNSGQLEEIPVNGRNFVSLLSLQPGVVTAFSFNSFQGMSIFASQDTHVNGLRGDSNNFLIEGSPSTRTRANGASIALPSMDSIGEVNIVTNGYMPEYSRAGGGQMVVQLKSGTEAYHGSAFEFLRNDKLDARSFFATKVEKLRYNDFGFSIGGPLIPHHKKLFFNWTEEWFRRGIGNTPAVQTVPSVKDRSGDLSDYCVANPTLCPIVPAYLNGVNGLVAGQPFPGNQIPGSLFSRNGSAFVNLYLPPSSPGETLNFVTTYNTFQSQREDDIKGDYYADRLKSHASVSLRHFRQDTIDPSPTGSSSQLINRGFSFPSRAATIDLNTTFSPTLLNDFSFTAAEDIGNIPVSPDPKIGGRGVDRASLGINFPYALGVQSKDIPGKIPTVIIQGFPDISGQPYPSNSAGPIFTVQDVVSKVTGNHTFKFGLWYEHDGENDNDQIRVTPGGSVGNNMNGQFKFQVGSNPRSTGSPLADVLLGNFLDYSEIGFRNFTLWRANQIGLFGQDSWKVTPRLTVEGGLRWDYFAPYHSVWCNFSTFDQLFYSTAPGQQQVVNPTTGFVTGGNPFNGIAVPCNQLPQSAIGHFAVFGQRLTSANFDAINAQLRNQGLQRGLTPEIFQKHYRNFQPRLGFAYDPFGKGTTAIRASAGLFYNHNTLSDVSLMGGNSPFQSTVQVSNGLADNPGGSVGGVFPQLPIPITGQDLFAKIPVVYQWNFTAEHMFLNTTLVQLGYVGTRGRNLLLNSDLNQPVVGTFTSNPNINPAALRPFPGLGRAQVALNDSSSFYDSLQVSVQRRFHRGLQYGVAYTWSKSIDYGSSLYATATDTYNLRLDRGLSDFDHRHILIFNYVYDLPFLKNSTSPVGKALGGWEVSGVTSFLRGAPLSIGSGSDAGVGGIGPEFANRVPGCNVGPIKSLQQWFNTACFTNPSKGTFGTAARGIVTGPGINNWDFGLFKNGPIIRERLRYQFRAEFFNVFNHPSFSSVSTKVTDSSFGRVTGVNAPRNIQFALKLLF